MANIFWVFVGGGIGSLSRYGINVGLANWSANFPLSTLIANLLACIVLGFISEWSLKVALVHEFRLLLITGFCGGFSTFSTFSNETFSLFSEGNPLFAFLNIAGNLLLCLAGIYIGMRWAS